MTKIFFWIDWNDDDSSWIFAEMSKLDLEKKSKRRTRDPFELKRGRERTKNLKGIAPKSEIKKRNEEFGKWENWKKVERNSRIENLSRREKRILKEFGSR